VLAISNLAYSYFKFSIVIENQCETVESLPISLFLGSLCRTLCASLPTASDCMARNKSFSGMSVSLRIS